MQRRFAEVLPAGIAAVKKALVEEAIAIGEEDIEINRRIGLNGKAFIRDGDNILTHCNAGALATAGYGTALGVIRAAREEGKNIHVYADETRPVLQGARLTCWELMEDRIPATLITDSMAGFLMAQGKVNLVIVGADRIAANGDTANKIGTYSLAVLAKEHGIPFYVAAPAFHHRPLDCGRQRHPHRRAAQRRGEAPPRASGRPPRDRSLQPRLRRDPASLHHGHHHRSQGRPASL